MAVIRSSQATDGNTRPFKLKYQKVPVIIRAMNDDQALVAMVDSNLNREHIRISEKAFAYDTHKMNTIQDYDFLIV